MNERNNKDRDLLGNLPPLGDVLLHELKTPLAYLSSNNNYLIKKIELLKQTANTEQIKTLNGLLEVIGENKEGIEHMNSLLKGSSDLLSGGMHRERCSIHDTIRSARKLVEPHVAGDLEINLELNAHNDCISGDLNWLRQVFINLMINAAESFEEDNNKKEIRISSIDRQEGLEVAVKDNACGIDVDKVDSIFDRYVTAKTAGRGLGLFISKEILKAHAGEIYCTSKVGQGSEFFLHFKEIL